MDDVDNNSNSNPIIVCGMPRSGTRMTANVLNAHPAVLITDEFHNLEFLRAFISEYRKTLLLKKFSRQQALRRQALAAKQIWVSYSVDWVLDRRRDATVIGNKTPSLERRFQVLENIFVAEPPRYIYCLRDAPSVLRSIKNLKNIRMNRNTVAENLDQYLASVEIFEAMKEAFPDRVFLCNISAKGQRSNSSFYGAMFNFLGLRVDDELLRGLDAMQPQNTLDAVRRVTGQIGEAVVELTAEEQHSIDRSAAYKSIRERYAFA